MPRRPIVEMHNASVRRGDRTLLEAVHLDIHDGERLAIIGPNGSGKSSLVKVMMGELPHDSSIPGSWVRIMGTENWDLFDVRKAFGLVSSDLQVEFRRQMTGLEVVLSGIFGSIGTNRSQGVDGGMMGRAREALEAVRSTHLASRLVSAMSTGEARRVLMARALVNRPRALILDEPMTSLDLIGKGLVRDAMRSAAKGGQAFVLVTPDPSEIVPEVERVVMMRGGRIFSDGGIETLNEGRLSELFGVRVRLHRLGDRYLTWS